MSLKLEMDGRKKEISNVSFEAFNFEKLSSILLFQEYDCFSRFHILTTMQWLSKFVHFSLIIIGLRNLLHK